MESNPRLQSNNLKTPDGVILLLLRLKELLIERTKLISSFDGETNCPVDVMHVLLEACDAVVIEVLLDRYKGILFKI